MIRSFLALGFNRDEAGKRVFDGAYPHIGGGLMPLNVRFGQPVPRLGRADRSSLSRPMIFPSPTRGRPIL